jgi:hypothetical protein
MSQSLAHNRLTDPLIIIIFLAALFIPPLTWMVQEDAKVSEVEKRPLQSFPVWQEQTSITGFSRSLDSYFKDHFGFRSWLIHRYHREMSKRFGGSGVAHVSSGLDGWLFLTGDNLLEDLQGRLRLSNREEERFWTILKQKKAWLEQQGIAYIFMVAPNKQSIYPEYNPRFYEQSKKVSRLEHLLTVGADRNMELLLDVRERIRSHKETARLFNKTDTHWNYRGAYLAYLALMERVRQQFPDLELGQEFTFAPLWREQLGGDLAMMIGRRQDLHEQVPILDDSEFQSLRRQVSKELTGILNLRQLKPLYTKRKDTPLRVLVLRDSFFNHLRPFISESFGEVLYVWQYYDASTLAFLDRAKLSEVIAAFHPDLLIEETIERFVNRFLIVNDQDWSIRPEKPFVQTDPAAGLKKDE